MTADAEIHIVPYDASWPERFEEERKALTLAIGDYVTGTIEHVGSTAVPGLAAKPVIDIMAGVESLDRSRPVISMLEALEYCYFPYRPDDEHWFCKPSPEFPTHHLHVVPFNRESPPTAHRSMSDHSPGITIRPRGTVG